MLKIWVRTTITIKGIIPWHERVQQVNYDLEKNNSVKYFFIYLLWQMNLGENMLVMDIAQGFSYSHRVCHGFWLAKRDDYFRVTFDHCQPINVARPQKS